MLLRNAVILRKSNLRWLIPGWPLRAGLHLALSRRWRTAYQRLLLARHSSNLVKVCDLQEVWAEERPELVLVEQLELHPRYVRPAFPLRMGFNLRCESLRNDQGLRGTAPLRFVHTVYSGRVELLVKMLSPLFTHRKAANLPIGIYEKRVELCAIAATTRHFSLNEAGGFRGLLLHEVPDVGFKNSSAEVLVSRSREWYRALCEEVHKHV